MHRLSINQMDTYSVDDIIISGFVFFSIKQHCGVPM